MSSPGNKARVERRTLKPPTPESKAPIGAWESTFLGMNDLKKKVQFKELHLAYLIIPLNDQHYYSSNFCLSRLRLPTRPRK
jgi:hypothetical protein